MPEVRQRVETYEVNYVCDACGHGMMELDRDSGPEREHGEYPHVCMICGHRQNLKGGVYPRIIHLGADDAGD